MLKLEYLSNGHVIFSQKHKKTLYCGEHTSGQIVGEKDDALELMLSYQKPVRSSSVMQDPLLKALFLIMKYPWVVRGKLCVLKPLTRLSVWYLCETEPSLHRVRHSKLSKQQTTIQTFPECENIRMRLFTSCGLQETCPGSISSSKCCQHGSNEDNLTDNPASFLTPCPSPARVSA